jgi:hypothetical protein
MNRVWGLCGSVLIAGVLCVSAWGQSARSAGSRSGTAAKEPAKTGSKETTAEKAPAPRPEDRKGEVEKSEWTIELRDMTGKGEPFTDTISFFDGKFYSSALTTQGYPPTNYTLRDDSGMLVWETMQSKEGSPVANWRGELNEGKMRGILAKNPAGGGPGQDFSFISKGTKKITIAPVGAPMPEEKPASAVKQPPASQPAPAPAPAPAEVKQEQPKKEEPKKEEPASSSKREEKPKKKGSWLW